jgi:tetratricopeptide (TPR) repeat protein
VTGASIQEFQTLLKHALVSHGNQRRFEVHPLIRQFAREKLKKAGKVDAAKKSHLNTFVAFAIEQKDKMTGDTYIDSLNNLTVEYDNLRAALDWSLSGNEIAGGVSLTVSLYSYWSNRSQIREAAHYTNLAISLQPDLPELYAMSGFHFSRLGQQDKAKESLRYGIQLAEEQQSHEVLASCYRQLAGISIGDNASHELEAYLNKAFEIARMAKSPRELAACHSIKGMFLNAQLAEPDTILEENQQALSIYKKMGDLLEISRIVYNTSLIYIRLNNLEKAKELCNQSLEIKKSIGDKAGAARRLSVLASLDILDEELERAQEYLTESIEINRELGERQRLWYSLLIQGFLFMVSNQFENAHIVLEESLELALQIANDTTVKTSLGTLALLSILQNNLDLSMSYITQSIEFGMNMSMTPWTTLTALANYFWYKDDFVGSISLAVYLSERTKSDGAGYTIVNSYFLNPLVYRIKQKLGDDAWEEAINKTKEISAEQLMGDIRETLAT